MHCIYIYIYFSILDNCPILRDLLNEHNSKGLYREYYQVPKVNTVIENEYEMVTVEKLNRMKTTIKQLRSRCYKLKKSNANLKKVIILILNYLYKNIKQKCLKTV